MPSTRFGPAVPGGARTQTHALYRAATMAMLMIMITVIIIIIIQLYLT